MTDTDPIALEEEDSHGKQKERNTEANGDTDCGQINMEPETLPIYNCIYTNMYNVYGVIIFVFLDEH